MSLTVMPERTQNEDYGPFCRACPADGQQHSGVDDSASGRLASD